MKFNHFIKYLFLDIDYELINVGAYQNFCPDGTENMYSEHQCRKLAMGCRTAESPSCKVKLMFKTRFGTAINGLKWKHSKGRSSTNYSG